MSRRALAVVVFVQFAALTTICLLIGDNAWDDGALTLAFSRTFAQHGRVALTPHSEVVEGFSSVLWFLLNALPALARPSYQKLILASQILSALCISASTALLGRTCALLRLDKLFSTLTVVSFAAWGCSFAEAGNGMEMGLLAAAVLLMVNELLAPRPRLFWLSLGVFLAVTARFEAIAYVGLIALSVIRVPGRRGFWCIVIACAGTILLLSGWRLAVFSDVLPNTYWAKRWPPYAAFDLLGRLAGAVELPSFFVPFLVALVIAWRSGFDLRGAVRERRRALSILAYPVLGAILVGALIGKAWGYYGRMSFFAFPLALPLFALLLAPWVNANRNRTRVGVATGAFAISLGVSMVAFPSGPLGAAFHGGSFGVTPHTYAATGQIFRRFAAAADLQHPTLMTPDLGGLALCCEEFRIVDLGLLSNRQLSHRGHAALGTVLETESPEVIEAHWKWATAGKLYDLPTFRARYAPAFADGTKFWLRRDVAKSIESKGRGCWVNAERPDVQEALRTHRYAKHDLPEDRSAFERPPGILFALDFCAGG